MTADDRPNVLVIQADQLAPQALGAYGNGTVRTPHIDALAAEGVVFDRAYCNSPLCVPSRASMMTGELPSTIEVYDNAAELAASAPTFAHHLRARGYRTALAGRMHFIGPDQLHGFEERLTTDVYPADLEMVPDWELEDDQRLPWYHGPESVLDAGPSAATLQRDYDEEVLFRTLRHLTDMARTADGPAGGPFLLVSSFIHPHDPYEPPLEHWERYADVPIDAPAVDALPLAELDPHSRRLRRMYGLDGPAPGAERVARARRAYYASVSYVDDLVGRVLARLDELGLRERTVVVLTADHGDMLGERGLWYKMSPFEGSARVPLIVRAPGRVAPGRVGTTVSLVDLLPTLNDVADGGLGHRPPAEPLATDERPAPGMPRRIDPTAGHSLLPLVRGDAEAGRRDGAPAHPDRAVVEYLAEGVRAPHLTLVRGRHKLVICPGDPDLLFDLDADPDERRDLAGAPEHAELLADLRAELLAGRDLDALRERVLASQRRRRLVRRALETGRRESWDHAPRDRSAEQYVRGDFWTAIDGGQLRGPEEGTATVAGERPGG
ncbi:choline-sulfatase [Patulibacter sp. S7RM1-6]